MKCLCLITSLPIGGAEKSLLRLIDNSNDEVEYLLISLDRKRDMESSFEKIGVKIINLNLKGRISDLSNIIYLYKTIKEWRPDLIYAWMYHAMFLSLICKLISPSIPIVWSIRHNNLERKLNKLTTIILAHFLGFLSFVPRRIVYCSNESISLHLSIGYKKKKSMLIENGFDSNEFKNRYELSYEYRNFLRNKYFKDLMPNDLIIACCARFDPLKRFENFVSVASLLSDRVSDKVTFCLIGEGVIENKEMLLNFAKKEHHQKFSFFPAINSIDEMLLCVDIFVQTSKSESFPNIVAEAMLTGAAVVATDVGQTSRIVGGCGVIVPPDSIGVMVNELEVLVSNRKLRQSYMQSAADQIRKNFGIRRSVEKHLKMFSEII